MVEVAKLSPKPVFMPRSVAAPAFAFTACHPDGFGGINFSDRGGWRDNGFGGLQGTGNNSGGGWRDDSFGGYRGTGNLSGHTCRPDGFGGMRCN